MHTVRESKRVVQVKVLAAAAEPEDLSSIPSTRMVEGENGFLQVVLSVLHTKTHMCTQAHVYYMRVLNKYIFKIHY